MSGSLSSQGKAQGFGSLPLERLPLPHAEQMSEAQRRAMDAIVKGPRKGIFGPFIPLMQMPDLMERVGQLGETLRFAGSLAETVRELAICVVARETSNQFEWQTHAALAIKAGISVDIVDALAAGRRVHGLPDAEQCAVDFVGELMQRHGISDAAYADAKLHFGEAGVVELTTLVGYFVMVCWVMNVARTPGPDRTITPPLTAFPG